jgi:hypothetical protein
LVSFEEIQAGYYMIAATGVLVAAAYYVMNIRATLQTRQAQMFMQIYNQSHNDPTFLDAWRKMDSISWGTYEEFKNLLKDEEKARALIRVGSFYEGLGVLVKERLIDIRLVALLMTIMTRTWWEKYKPIIEDARKQLDYPRYLSESEYLYNELMKYLEKHPELKT